MFLYCVSGVENSYNAWKVNRKNIPVSICDIQSFVNCMTNQMELNVIKIYSRLIWSVMVLSMYGVAFF